LARYNLEIILVLTDKENLIKILKGLKQLKERKVFEYGRWTIKEEVMPYYEEGEI